MKLFLLQLLAHVGLLGLFLYGETYHFGITLFVYFLTGCFGMTMTFHRGLSHNSWNMPTWFKYFGTICGIYGLTGSSISWVASHKKHHAFSDTEKDPHSPLTKGIFKVQFLSMFEPVHIKYVTNMLRDPFHLFLHKNYFKIHALIIVALLLLDPMLLIAAYLAPAAILWNLGSAVNNLNHLYGYKPHVTNDHSTNNLFTGYLVWGEGWHNTHHAHPKRSMFGEQWWEVDIGGSLIELIGTKS